MSSSLRFGLVVSLGLLSLAPGCPSATSCPAGTFAVPGGACVPDDAGADGSVDEADAPIDAPGLDVPEAVPDDGGTDTCVSQTFYADTDEDEHGDPEDMMTACVAPSGYVASGDDCDDGDPLRHPALAEACDGLDNDCDAPMVDEDFACEQGASVACTTTCGSTGMGDCSSTCEIPDAADCTPPAESCGADADGADDDCDGQTDEGLQTIGPAVTLGTAAERVIVLATSAGYVAVTDRSTGIYAQAYDATGTATGTEQRIITTAVDALDAYSTGSHVVIAWNTGTDFSAAVLDTTLTPVTSARTFAPRPEFSGMFRVVADATNVLVVFYDGGDGSIHAVRRSFPGLVGGSAAFPLVTDARDDLTVTVDPSGNRGYVAYRGDSNQIRVIRFLTSGSVEGSASNVTSGSTTKRAPAAFFSASDGRRRLGVAWLDDAASPVYRFTGYEVAIDGSLGTASSTDLLAMGPPTAPRQPLALTWAGGRWMAMMLDAGVPVTDSFFRVVEVTEPASGPLTSRTSMLTTTSDNNAVSLAPGADGAALLGISRGSGSTRLYRFGCP